MGLFDPKRRNNLEDDFEDAFVDIDADVSVIDEEEVKEEPVATEAPRASASFASTEIGSAASLELKVVRPERFEDTADIADHLLAGRTVVLNMDFINKEETRRLIDFLSGVAYSIRGRFQRVATGTYIITPRNVEVSEATKEDEPSADEAFEDASFGNDFI